MHELAETLADALKVLGCKVERDVVLEGRSGRVVTASLLVETQGRTYALWVDDQAQEDLAAAEALRADLGADGLVLALRPTDDEEPEGVACWPRHVVASLLGDALLAECGWTPRPVPWPAPVAPSRVEDTLPPAFTTRPPADPSPFGAPDARPSPAGDDHPLWLPPFPDLASSPGDEMPGPADPSAEAADEEVPIEFPSSAPWDLPTGDPSEPEGPPASSPFTLDALHPTTAHGIDRHATLQERAAAAADLGPPLSGSALDPELWDLSIEEEQVRPRRLPVRLTPRDADSIARRQGFTVDRYLLVLQPIHLFDVEVDTLRQGRLDAWTESMRLQVHGTDRSITSVDPQKVDPAVPDLLAPTREVQVEERTLRVQPERARELAHAWLKATYTRTVEVPAGGDLFEYTERRRVTPRDDQIRVSPIGLFHRPLWRLEGPAGALELDAMTGELVSSQARSYPDTMLIE